MAEEESRGIPIEGGKVFGRLAFTFLLICAIALGAAAGLLFVYASDLPEIHALEDYRPNVVTELYADDGQPIGSFALQRRILLTYEQIPRILRDAIITTEDQHFEEHWGVDFPRVLEAAWHNMVQHRIAEGASTLTMQLAGGLFLNRSDRSFHRKIEETMLAMQIERHYTKEQIFTMYCNQIYLGPGTTVSRPPRNIISESLSAKLTLPEAATACRHHSRADLFADLASRARAGAPQSCAGLDGRRRKDHPGRRLNCRSKRPWACTLRSPRNDLAPYFVEEIRQYLEQPTERKQCTNRACASTPR